MPMRGYVRTHHRPARWLLLALAGLALTLAMLPAVTGTAPGTGAARAHAADAARTSTAAYADDITASDDNLRTGWDQSETAMGPSVVPGFSTLFDTKVGGSVYAQPLVVPVASGSSSSTVVVATENDYVYGLNPGTGAVNWTNHLGNAFVIGKSTDPKLAKCGDLTPNIGITGTPSFNSANQHVYFFANIVNTGTNTPKYYLVELDPSDGSVVSKTLVSGHPSNDSALSFNAAYQMERPGVLLLNGWAYGAFASHCDHQPYVGYIAGVNMSNPSQTTLWTDESKTAGNMAGIWQGGGGVMSDGSSIFVASGNGVSPPKDPDSKPPGTMAESVMRLQPNSTGNLSVKDFFSPANAPTLDAADSDFGSGGPMGFPVTMGGYPAVLAQSGKIGEIYLLDRSNLGGREQGTNNTDKVLFHTKNYGGQYGHPAFFGDISDLTQANAGSKPVDNDFMFYVGKNDVMRVFRVGIASNNKPVISDVGSSSLTYGFSSGSPVVTSNGTDPASAVVWVIQTADSTGSNAELGAYALGKLVSNGTAPSSCTSKAVCVLKPIWHSQTFTASKFSIPATSNGIVYAGDRKGNVWAWGKAPAGAPLQAATATLPPTTVNTTTTQTLSITAKRPTVVTGVSASTGASNAIAPASQFTIGQATRTPAGSTTSQPVTFPVTLAKGDKLSVPVTFRPAAPGTADGTISFRLSNGKVRIVPVTGTGARTGLYSDPAAVAFPLSTDWGLGAVPVGVQIPELVDIINGGSTPDTVRSVTKPSAPFAAANLPTPGQTLVPGQALVVALTYTPTQPGPAHGSLVITDSAGRRLVVPLSGVGTGDQSQVRATQSTIDFGSVPVGTTVSKAVHILNSGTVPATVNVPSPPAPPFHSRYRVFAGTPFNPGYDLAIPIMFSPTSKGTFTFHYVFHWKDRLGNHSLTVVLTGTGV